MTQTLLIGERRVPSNPPDDTSKAKTLVRPRIAPKTKVTQSIPDATMFAIEGVASNAKLKVTTDSKANTIIEITTSLVLTSSKVSFQTITAIWYTYVFKTVCLVPDCSM